MVLYLIVYVKQDKSIFLNTEQARIKARLHDATKTCDVRQNRAV